MSACITLWKNPRKQLIVVFCIFVGEKLVTERFAIIIDHAVVNKSLTSMLEAVMVLFAAYYCLNIQYPECSAATLEFIQRYVIVVNTGIYAIRYTVLF